MRFDIEQYRGNYVMHCKTKKEAETFLGFLHSIGESWCDGMLYTERSNYEKYGSNTCYEFNIGKFCNLDYFVSDGFEILEFEMFDWDNFDWDNYDISPTDKEVKNLDKFISQFAIN